MNAANMLSAKYVKLHGMSDPRWTTNDKMTQYKGLIKLYTRDRKISGIDKTVEARKQKMQMKVLKNDIDANRDKLQNMINGDKQELRNTLAEHKDFQLAFQELPALKVVDHVYQYNFAKRKKMDLLLYETNQRKEVLIGLKLRKSVLEDRMTYPDDNFPPEKRAEIITGKVQDAILKKEAAMVVHDAYLKIINIMRKDALYYDVILVDLRKDAKRQGKCMLQSTQLGQLAMEYLDDRRDEYKLLEMMVKVDMNQRLTDLDVVSKQLNFIQDNMKTLIRRDSDINMGRVDIPPEFSNKELAEQVRQVENTLSALQAIAMVPNFESIYPCLTEQLRQKQRLAELVKLSSENHDTLLNRFNHASVMRHNMENTMIENTNAYMEDKKRIAEETEAQRKRKKAIDAKLKVKNLLLAKIKGSLKQLEAMSAKIEDGTSRPPVDKDQVMLPLLGEPLYREKFPDPGEEDGRRIVELLLPKVQKLVASAGEMMRAYKEEQENAALMVYGNNVGEQMQSLLARKEVKHEEPLIDEALADIASVPTREEIKRISAGIVKQCAVDPDLAPVVKK